MAETITLARPYAKAAFEYALAAGQLAAWSKSLTLLAEVSETETIRKVLNSPSLTSQQQAQTLIDVCGEELDEKAKNFVAALAANKRLALLAEIHNLFEQLKAQQEKSVDVDVTSAFELDSATEEKLAAALKKTLQRDVKLSTQVNKSLLGGVVVRAGDTIIDGSVRGRLAKLAEAMNS